METSTNDLTGKGQTIENIFSDGQINLTPEAYTKLAQQSPPCIINIFAEGGVSVDNRSIKDSFNDAKLDGNASIQSENVNQTQLISKAKSEEAFQELFSAIEKLENPSTRQQAQFNAELLQEAVEKKDAEKGQKLLGFLKESIGTIDSLTTIASFFGLTL